jgi:hypothetical protein
VAILVDGIERTKGVGVDSGARGVTGRWEHLAEEEHALVDGPAWDGITRRRIEVNMVNGLYNISRLWVMMMVRVELKLGATLM